MIWTCQRCFSQRLGAASLDVWSSCLSHTCSSFNHQSQLEYSAKLSTRCFHSSPWYIWHTAHATSCDFLLLCNFAYPLCVSPCHSPSSSSTATLPLSLLHLCHQARSLCDPPHLTHMCLHLSHQLPYIVSPSHSIYRATSLSLSLPPQPINLRNLNQFLLTFPQFWRSHLGPTHNYHKL